MLTTPEPLRSGKPETESSWRRCSEVPARVLSILSLTLALVAPTLVAAAPPPQQGMDGMQLEKVVMLLRHGVRSPTQTPQELSDSSHRPWPDWGIASGELTVHGAKLIGLLGSYYREYYGQAGLLADEACPDASRLSVWADNSTRRIPFSAQVLVEAMFPGCKDLRTGFQPQTAPDPLFHPVELGTCSIHARTAEAALLEATGGDVNRPMREEKEALTFMQSLLKVRPRGVCAGNAPTCGIDGFANVIHSTSKNVTFEGGLKSAATLGENILLEYVEGFPVDRVGWGEAGNPAAITQLIKPRNRYLEITRRTPYLASRHGTPLARELLAALDDVPGVSPKVAQTLPPGTDLVAIVGRDIHLAIIGGLMGLKWTLPGQPDLHGSGVTLAFERWRHSGNGLHYVRPVIHYQTLQQMRGAETLTLDHPPGRVALRFPGCADEEINGACSLSKVRSHISAALAEDCPSK